MTDRAVEYKRACDDVLIKRVKRKRSGTINTAVEFKQQTCRHVAKELEYLSKTCIKCGYMELE